MNSYIESQDYESFIRLARRCDRDQHGARNSYMQNLMEKESDGVGVRHLKHKKLLADVKKYMTSAAIYAMNRRDINKEDKEILATFPDRIEATDHSSVLLEIASQGIQLLLKYKSN